MVVLERDGNSRLRVGARCRVPAGLTWIISVIGETCVQGDDNRFGVGFLAGQRERHASPVPIVGPRQECACLPSMCAVAARGIVVQPIDTGLSVREYLRAPADGRAMWHKGGQV
jgi:hypothetical protein